MGDNTKRQGGEQSPPRPVNFLHPRITTPAQIMLHADGAVSIHGEKQHGEYAWGGLDALGAADLRGAKTDNDNGYWLTDDNGNTYKGESKLAVKREYMRAANTEIQGTA